MPLTRQVWFKNRRAKFRKKQRSLQKEQLQKQKEASGEGQQEEGKVVEPPSSATSTSTSTATGSTVVPPECHSPPPLSCPSSLSEAEQSARPQPSELSVEVNVTSPEQSGSESAAEDNTDREEELKCFREEPKGEVIPLPGNRSPSCKHLSPKSGGRPFYFYLPPLLPFKYSCNIPKNNRHPLMGDGMF